MNDQLQALDHALGLDPGETLGLVSLADALGSFLYEQGLVLDRVRLGGLAAETFDQTTPEQVAPRTLAAVMTRAVRVALDLHEGTH